jgi:MSHA pilin protein MshC
MRVRGFTMIELIVTMMIVGILAIAIVPRMDNLRGFDEIGYRDQVRATLEYARKTAVAQRRSVRVSVAASVLTVEVQRQTPEGEGAAAWAAVPLPGRNNNAINPPAGVSLNPAAGAVIFDALGRPDAGAAFVVSGGAGTITVEAETGYVH